MKFAFKERVEEEISQAKARIAYIAIVSLYLANLFLFDEFGTADGYLVAQLLLVAVLLYALFLVFFLPKHMKFSPLRQCFTIILDLGTTSYLMYLLGQWGAAFYPLYLWVISGNGLRFGTPYLWFSMAIGFIGFATLISFNTYWIDNIPTALGLLFGVVVLPSFFSVLIKRLHQMNDRLQESLRSTELAATRDPLTGLCNRISFVARFGEEATRADRNDQRFSLLYLDLDRFKPINDKYGHEAGDLLLKAVAERLNREIRTADMAVRLGGDEFAVVTASGNERGRAEQLARRLAEAISSRYEIEHWNLEVGVSIGVASYPDDGKDIETLMRIADERMYLQKGAAARRRQAETDYRSQSLAGSRDGL